MKRSHSETFPLSNGGGGDQYLYIILTYACGKYIYSFHRIRVSDLMVSRSSKRSRHGHGHGHGHEKPQKLPKPVLKLPSDRYPIFMGFFSAGSKIYMFGGQELCTGRRGLAYWNCYVFDTSKKNNPSKVVKDGPPMVFGKYRPVVLGPLHGKFYVVESTLAASNHLEEFDPQTETWTPLPSAPIAPYFEEEDDRFDFLCSTIGKKYAVVSQAIVGDRILLSTKEKGIYAYHVISRTWEHWSSLDGHGKARLPYSSGSEFRRGFWYAFPATSYHLSAYYFDEDNRLFRPYRAHGVRRPSRLVKCRTDNKIVPMGKRTLFVVRSGYAHGDVCQWLEEPYHITVDMCKFTRFRVKNGGKPKHPEVSKQYSATFAHKLPLTFEFLDACLVVAST